MKKSHVFFILLIIIGIFLFVQLNQKDAENPIKRIEETVRQKIVPTPTPFTSYSVPTIQSKDGATILFVGDSMTLALGPHPYKLSVLLNEQFDKGFAIDNYSVGSVSILSLEELLTKKTQINGLTEKPAIEREFDILVIESFGHNPLSQFPVEEGLRIQEDILDKTMVWLIKEHPQAVIIFLATFAPDEENYAQGAVGLSSESSRDFSVERKMYIENFISYARQHNIPLLNMYEQSYNPDGSFRRELITQLDNIHPSQIGIELIQQKMFEYIVDNQFLK